MGFCYRTEAFESANRVLYCFAKLLVMAWTKPPTACRLTAATAALAFRHRTLQMIGFEYGSQTDVAQRQLSEASAAPPVRSKRPLWADSV
jgi:hypothetical protein